MSKLSDLQNKPVMVKLSNGEEIGFYPMTINDEIEISRYQKNEDFFGAITYLVKSSIKRAVPDATEEEIDNINKGDLDTITKAVLKINGLEKKEEEPMKN